MSDNEYTARNVTAPGLLGAIAFLSIAQASIGQFVGHGIPLFLRAAEQPGHIVGLMYLASIPYILKVLWAPFIDRYSAPVFGHYRAWILAGQICAGVLLFVLSFFDPANHPYYLIATVVLLTTVMATQDASTSGLMVRGLSPKDRARGTALRAAGSALSGILVGAFVIYLLSDMGWQTVVWLMSGLVLISFLLILFFPLDRGWKVSGNRPSLTTHFRSFKDQRVRHLLWIKIFVGMGLALTYGLKSIVLIDAGFEVGEAALISLVYGSVAGLLTAMLIRPVVDALGGFPVLAIIAFLTAIYCVSFGIVFQDGLGETETLAYVLIANALTFAAFPASRSILLSYCNPTRAATDFSAFISVEGVFLLLLAGTGAALSDVISFSLVLWFGAVGSLVGGFIALYGKGSEQEALAVSGR